MVTASSYLKDKVMISSTVSSNFISSLIGFYLSCEGIYVNLVEDYELGAVM